jgi:hypothetical protein
MKLQASAAFDPKTLQSQTRQYAGNRLSLNALVVVHGRLERLSKLRQCFFQKAE